MFAQTVLDYFNEHSVQSMDSDCLNWEGELLNNKNPFIYVKGSGVPAVMGRRVAYFMKRGDLPEGKSVFTTCGNPKCVAPDHMALAGEPGVVTGRGRPKGAANADKPVPAPAEKVAMDPVKVAQMADELMTLAAMHGVTPSVLWKAYKASGL